MATVGMESLSFRKRSFYKYQSDVIFVGSFATAVTKHGNEDNKHDC